MLIAGLATGNKIGIAVAAGIFIAIALISSFVLPRLNPDFPGKAMAPFVALTIALMIGMIATIVLLAKEEDEHAAEGETTTEIHETTPSPTPSPGGDPAAGKSVFAKAGCGSCHVLKSAGASGQVGPDLDATKPPTELVVERVTNGAGVMPPFKGELSEQEIADVAAFVASSAGA